MSDTTGRVRCGLWITAGSLFFGSLLIDLMDGHSLPAIQTLLNSSRTLAVVVFIAGSLLLLRGWIDKIVQAAEVQPAETPLVEQLSAYLKSQDRDSLS